VEGEKRKTTKQALKYSQMIQLVRRSAKETVVSYAQRKNKTWAEKVKSKCWRRHKTVGDECIPPALLSSVIF